MKTLLLLLLTSITYASSGQFSKVYLFVGTYTDGRPGRGIYIYEFKPETGKLKPVSFGRNITNPSFLALSPAGNFVYACTETKLPGAGSVSAFRFDSVSGSLTLLNKQNSGGENPVYLSSSSKNEFLINGNYTEGTVSVFKIKPDGSLNPYSQLIRFQVAGPHARRQDQAHIHAVVFSPDSAYVFFS